MELEAVRKAISGDLYGYSIEKDRSNKMKIYATPIPRVIMPIKVKIGR
ncbi:hypothetical protein N752_11610 [Desulforamulus aquiferis]|nr:hypothetical protein [Desulforamulus aquiferis]RYD05003.1 hypothetical protein N752_11610 [Desulforamulus aquiferis]